MYRFRIHPTLCVPYRSRIGSRQRPRVDRGVRRKEAAARHYGRVLLGGRDAPLGTSHPEARPVTSAALRSSSDRASWRDVWRADPRPEGLHLEPSDPFISLKTTKYPAGVKHTVDVATESVGTQFLTRSEVSKLLGVSPNTVTRWAREGRLPCQVTLGGHHRFDRELVEQLRKSLYRAGNRLD